MPSASTPRGLRFGTDGVRGRAFTELTPGFVRLLGRAAVATLGPGPYLVARDTRESGPALEAALAAGLGEAGATFQLLGVLPTPGLACAAAADGVPAAMISASHNPFQDNGVKLFGPGGRKLDDPTQERIQAVLDQLVAEDPGLAGAVELPGFEPPREVDRGEEYLAALAASLQGRRLDGVKVVVDCANGAASVVAPEALRRAGCEVVAVNAEPDGRNINAGCGSTHPEVLQQLVVSQGADAGLALDGDADRVIAVDGQGRLVDGDRIIAICAADRADQGRLPDRTVVVTVMANLGFRQAMDRRGIRVVETPVGDRYVLEALEANGWVLGGEQSGHVIFRDLAPTGDGTLTGLQLLDVVARSGRSLAELSDEAMVTFPQVLRNVVVHGDRDAIVASLTPYVEGIAARLGSSGRILVRPSGTEPLVRVMAEAETEELAGAVVDELCAAVAALDPR